MPEITISLSPQMVDWIDNLVAEGHYLDAGDYLRDLMRNDQQVVRKQPRVVDPLREGESNSQTPQFVSSHSAYGEYDTSRFSDVSDQWGDKLWTFLTRADIVDEMKAKSDKRRPAIEAITWENFTQEFGEGHIPDRVKQFAGALVRQILERNGYRFMKSGYPTRGNCPFMSGSRYIRSEG